MRVGGESSDDRRPPSTVRAERGPTPERPADTNPVFGIAVGCLVSLPFWVGVSAILRAALR